MTKKRGELKLRPAKRRELKKKLALRDGLVAPEMFSAPDPMVRCAECDSLHPFSELTIGHITPRSEGGPNRDGNLRLECFICNKMIDVWRFKGFPLKMKRYAEGLVYDSVEVLDVRGGRVAFTSLNQAVDMAEYGKVTVVSETKDGVPAVVRLTEDIPIEKREDTPIPNLCVVCDARKYLSFFTYWPPWHPDGFGKRRTFRSAALCRKCRGEMQRRYEALYEVFASLPPVWPKPVRSRSVAFLIHARNLLKRGDTLPPAVETGIREAGVDPSALGEDGAAFLTASIRALRTEFLRDQEARVGEIRRRMVAAGFDFGGFFMARVAEERERLRPYLRRAEPHFQSDVTASGA